MISGFPRTLTSKLKVVTGSQVEILLEYSKSIPISIIWVVVSRHPFSLVIISSISNSCSLSSEIKEGGFSLIEKRVLLIVHCQSVRLKTVSLELFIKSILIGSLQSTMDAVNSGNNEGS